jgi:hypothetical protein
MSGLREMHGKQEMKQRLCYSVCVVSYTRCWLLLRGMNGTSQAKSVAVDAGCLYPPKHSIHLQENKENINKEVARCTSSLLYV